MKRQDILSLILDEMKGIRTDIKEVRQIDIPKLKEEMAVVKHQASTSAKVISGVGGIIAVGTSIAIAFFK